jgi:hypothetical protein
MKNLFGLIALLAILAGCGGNDEEKCVFVPDVSSVEVDFVFDQLHDSLVNVTSKTHLVDILTREPMIRDYIFRRTAYQNDSAFINALYHKLTNAHIDTLLAETKKVFGDGAALKAEFREAFANLKYYYPHFVAPRVLTVISGLETDLFVSDSLIIVSLDFYLGDGAKYRPNIYEYLLRQYNKENIVPSCMLIYGISNRFNATALDDKTVLADMIAYGKSFYFAKHMLPCVPDSVLMRYSAAEIRGSRQNQDLIWKRLIEDRVLYATSHVIKQKYLGERPKTTEVGPECPGRIGQWIGWQIVEAYMENHSQVTLPELMSYKNSKKLFGESGYKPRRR